MTNLKPYVVSVLVGILAGFLLCKKLTPTPKPEIQVVEKVVEKVVVKTNTHTVTKEVVRPDGTKETVVVSDEHTDSKTDHTQDSSVVTSNPFQYHYKFSPMLGYSFTDNKQTYGASLEKYVLPGLTAGIYAFPLDKHGGFMIGISF